jgi:hypothetical protein
MIVLRNKEFSLISRGIRFIKEIKSIDPLPMTVEEYSIFLFHESDVKKIFPSVKLQESFQKELCERLNRFYNFPKAAYILRKIGIGFTFAAFGLETKMNFLPIYGEDKRFTELINYSWSRINHIPKRYLFSSIGVGGTGIAFDYPGNKVEKISFNGFAPDELHFYSYLKKNPIEIFPKIYDISSDQVIMEKLITDSPKLDRYKKFIKSYIHKLNPLGTKREILWDDLYKDLGENHEFILFLNRVIEGMYKIFGRKTIGDLTRNNIAERQKTGEIVYFDPVIPGHAKG